MYDFKDTKKNSNPLWASRAEVAALVSSCARLTKLKHAETDAKNFQETHGYYSPPVGFSSLEDLNHEIHLEEERIARVFKKLFNAQAAKGNFDILAEPGVFSLFAIDEVVDTIAHGPHARAALTRLAKPEISISGIYGLSYVIDLFRAAFDSNTASLFIAKLNQMAEIFDTPDEPEREDLMHAIDSARKNLVQLPCLDEAQVSKLSIAIFKSSDIRSCRYFKWSIGANCPNSPQWKLLQLQASPFFVSHLNPEFFSRQLEDLGIDEATANILVNSWEGSLESFLVSAKTLSAGS